MKLTERLRREAEDIWERIFNHPFVVELYKGILPIDKFKFYLIQDYNYLVTMYKCLSLLSAKADYKTARVTLELAYLDATTEIENYNKLIKKFNLTIDEVTKYEPAPTNTAYMNFLLSTCSLQPLIEGLTAILPCFWSYYEIANYHKEDLMNNPIEIYREWGSVYLGKDYIKIIEMLRGLVDRIGLDYSYERLKYLFLLGSRYEYMFWDMAYKKESWPL